MNVKSNLREIGSCLLELDCEVPFREVELITQRILAQENSLEISEDLLAEVQCAVIKEALDAVFQSNDVRIVGVPEIENCDYQAGTLFSFQARCVVYPRPQIRYEKCIFLKDAQTTDSALIQRELVRIAANPAAQVFGMLAYRIEEGDVVHGIVEYKTAKGSYLPPKMLELVIGSLQDDRALSEALLGKTKGSSVEARLASPRMSESKEKQDSIVAARVFVQSITPHRQFDIDDALGKAFGLENLFALQKTIERQIAIQAGTEQRVKLLESVTQRLLADNHFSIPPELIQEYRLLFPGKTDLALQNFLTEKIIFERIAKAESIELERVDWDYAISSLAVKKGYESKQAEDLMADPEEYERMKHQLLKEKVIDHLTSA